MTTTITPDRAQQVIHGCDAPGCGEPWKWHDPETGLRYCDPCAARGWGHCATRCRDAENLPPQGLYATDAVGEYTALFDWLDKAHGAVTTAEIVHEHPAAAAPLGELEDATEAAMTRFDTAHNEAEPDGGDGEQW